MRRSLRRTFFRPEVCIQEGGGISKEIGYQSSYHYDVTSGASDFKVLNKVFVKEMGKNLEYPTDILLRSLSFGDIEIPIVIENQCLYFLG